MRDKYPNNPANIDARLYEESRLRYFGNYVKEKQTANITVGFWDKNKPNFNLSRLVASKYPKIAQRKEYNNDVDERRIRMLELLRIEQQQYQLELLDVAHNN